MTEVTEKELNELIARHPEPATVGEVLAVNEAIGVLSKRIADLGAQLDRLVLHEARLHDLENRPALKYLGVWRNGEQYEAGSFCTHAGGLFFAHTRTSARPGQSKEWQLAVKSGRAT